MRFLVVGSSTFLGAPLAESLAEAGHDVSILHPDPRAADPSWLKRFHCHFGQCREGHVLHESLEGIERVVACLASDRDEAELEQTCDLASAALLHGVGSIVKLSTPAPLRNAPWHPMRVRRHADLLLDGQETNSCIAEVGWIGETLLPMTLGNRMLLPHPVSCPGRMRWQGRRKAVERLSQLVQTSQLPRRAAIRGDDYATLAEISSRRVSKHAHLERIFLPGRFFRWLERLSIKPAFAGCRMVYGMGTSDPAPPPNSAPEDAIRDC